MSLNSMTHLQAAELIDSAAMEDRLYHFNGGQSYLKISNVSNVLMVIDTSRADKVEVSLHDGTEYFKTYAQNCFTYSERMRMNPMRNFFKLPVQAL